MKDRLLLVVALITGTAAMCGFIYAQNWALLPIPTVFTAWILASIIIKEAKGK